jgi:hypothetical protein
MKTPRIAFNKDALLSFLLSHGEKIIAAMVGLLACGLAWGGLSAMRTMRPSQEQQPQAIIADAATTAEHVEAVKIAPDDELTSEKGLAKTVAQWLSPEILPMPPHALFNKPLFSELARRSNPDILPIEDLRAVSGVIILAVKPKVAGDRPAPDRPLNLDVGNAAKPAKPPRGGGRGGPMPPVPQPDAGMMPPRPDQVQSQGKIAPYILVTGLIPIVKQQEEYDRRFTSASFRDAVRDTPSWNSYRIERTEVLPGTAEKWTPVDTKALARRYSGEWAGLQPEPLLPQLLLPPAQERRDSTLSPIPFCSPLPQLADGAWGFNALHPWFAEFLQRDAEEKNAKAKAEQEDAASNSNVFGGTNAAPFDGPPGVGTEPPGVGVGPPGMGVGPPGMGVGPPGMETQVAKSVEYSLFRFVDFTVLPGRTYRYRVRAACWNPNLNVPSRHLVDASIAKQNTIESPDSNATTPVAVPDSTRMLVQPVKKEYLKKLKAGVVPAMILGEKLNAGAFALRALMMEVGGLANVDPLLNKRGDPRSRGDAIVTDRVLLDVRGRLEDRAEIRSGKPTPPPEPLELIFLRPDGTFEVASSADSQQDIDRYSPTLPADDAGAAPGTGQPPAGVDSPFGNPFAPKK